MSLLGDLALLGHTYPHQLVDARPLVAVFTREHVHRDHLARLAMRHLQRSVAHIPRLLSEDCSEQSLLRRELAFALWRDLAHKDVAGAHLGANTDDPLVIQVLQGIFSDVGDVTSYLLRPQLGIARLGLVLLNVN